MEQSRFSVIIPVYNSEQTLSLCLESVKKQSVSPKEIIIVDSEDSKSTQTIASDFNAKYLNISINNISQKRNQGARQAESEYLLFLDSDCVLEKDWLINAQEIFETQQEIVACGSYSINVPEDSSWIAKTWCLHLKAWDSKNKNWLHTMGLAVKKETFEKVKGFNTSLTTCEDVDFCYRIQNYGEILSTDKLSLTHLSNPKNISEFFLREIWHGNDSLELAVKNKSELKELVYLLLPFYTLSILLVLIASIITFFTNNWSSELSYILLILFLPIIGLSFYAVFKTKEYNYLLQFVITYFTYILARTFAILKSKFMFQKV